MMLKKFAVLFAAGAILAIAGSFLMSAKRLVSPPP